MEKSFTPKTVVDFISSFEAGLNSNVSPLLLPPNQLSNATNISLRGGFVGPRPPFQKKTLNFGGSAALQNLVLNGFFQGAGYYRPDYGTETLIAQISGHLIQFTENGNSWTVTDISIAGDLNSATAPQVWMWQAEKWMIVQDGTGKLPIFFDGTTSRRSYGPSILLGTVNGTPTPSAPPAIGNTISVTLTSVYTGPVNVPVIFNKEYYQMNGSQNPQSTNIILTRITKTDGANPTVATGANVIALPNLAGITAVAATAYFGKNGVQRYFIDGLTFVNKLTLFSQTFGYNLPPFTQVRLENKQTSPSGDSYTAEVYEMPYGSPVNVPAGTALTLISNSPSYILGTISNNFVAPNVGSSIAAKMSVPFIGTDGAFVQIGNDYYTIQAIPTNPSNVVYLTNLTDNTTANYASGLTILSVPELPAGRNGAYGMGCNCVCLTDGLSYIIGDVVGAGSGTQAYNYRDAVLKVSQNTFLAGGGSFRLPGTGETITAMLFPPNLDTSLGQGNLQIGTGYSIFSNAVPGTNPSTWDALTFPIQTESLKDNGPLGQNSTVIVNSDIFFRSNTGISSLVQARREFFDWGNRPISNEVRSTLNLDDVTLLQYGSAQSFDNRFTLTTNPVSTTSGVIHRGFVSLNFDLITTLRQQSSPAWEGLWTGLNTLQVLNGRINGSLRSFAFSYNYNSGQIELYELLPETTTQIGDNGTTPIIFAFNTPILFNKQIKSLTELVQLRDGEVYLSDIDGTVDVKVYYKPDFYPCWTLWNEFEVSQKTDASNSKKGYRMRIGLGEPDPEPVEIGNNRPLRLGYFFQVRFVITGHCKFRGMRASAVTIPTQVFAPIEFPEQDAQIVDCDTPDEYAIYTALQGVPPSAPLPAPSVVQNYSNQTVYHPFPCSTLLVSTINYPTWITYDSTNQQFVGAANIFPGVDQIHADAAAQAALDSWVASVVAAGTVYCVATTPAACSGTDTNQYQIQGYTNSMFQNPYGAGYPYAQFTGNFVIKSNSNNCLWAASTNGLKLGGAAISCCNLYFDGTNWIFQVYWFSEGSAILFTYTKTTGNTAAGVYQKTYDLAGTNPATVTIVPLAAKTTNATPRSC